MSNADVFRVRLSLVLALLGALASVVTQVGPLQAQKPDGENLARGKACRFSPRPDYRYCTDPNDPKQLTDGKKTEEYFWTQPGTVGWSGASFATVSVDLGQVEPIAGASLRTAAGRAGVTWPMAVYVLVSDDGKRYRLAGELVECYTARNGALPDDYAIVTLACNELASRGRYVQFVLVPMPGGNYLFADEVEVHRGPHRLLSEPPAGRVVESAAALFEALRLKRSVRRRIGSDVRAARRLVSEAEIAPALNNQLNAELDAAAEQAERFEPSNPESFRAVLPLNEAHGRVFDVQARIWEATGHPGLTASAACPWDPLDPFATPAADRGSMRVDAMLGEARAAALNLANSGDGPLDVRIRLQGLPGGATPAWITAHDVPWTDTSQLQPVAAALPELEPQDGAWTVTVPNGLVQQVWLTVQPRDVPPGRYDGSVRIEAEHGTRLSVPLTVRVWPMQFPQQTNLWLGGWSYTDGGGSRGITDANRREFLRHLQERHVNAPWATSAVLKSFEFVDGRPDEIRLDTERFDDWIARWPEARAYLVFLSVAHYSGAIQTSLGGADIGSPEFDRRVQTWISAWVEHLRSKGLKPGQLGLLIHDEPHEGSEIGPLLAWARAIRKAEPEVLIWEDPTYREPRKAPAELFEACDVLCPNRPMWLSRAEVFGEFYGRQRQAGRTLQLYSCSGPARLLDPYSYYRLQAWHVWQIGGTGSFFWAFGDNSGTSSWNEYFASRGPFTPLFLDDATVTPGKQMEAIRESVQDYETLVMLRGAVAKAERAGRDDDLVRRGRKLLETGPAKVLRGASAETLRWHTPKDRTVADSVRRQILDVLGDLLGP